MEKNCVDAYFDRAAYNILYGKTGVWSKILREPLDFDGDLPIGIGYFQKNSIDTNLWKTTMDEHLDQIQNIVDSLLENSIDAKYVLMLNAFISANRDIVHSIRLYMTFMSIDNVLSGLQDIVKMEVNNYESTIKMVYSEILIYSKDNKVGVDAVNLAIINTFDCVGRIKESFTPNMVNDNLADTINSIEAIDLCLSYIH